MVLFEVLVKKILSIEVFVTVGLVTLVRLIAFMPIDVVLVVAESREFLAAVTALEWLDVFVESLMDFEVSLLRKFFVASMTLPLFALNHKGANEFPLALLVDLLIGIFGLVLGVDAWLHA